MLVYTFKVDLMDFKGISRHLEVSENCTFDNLHDLLFDAFNRYDEHLYQFFFPQGPAKSFRKIYDSPLVVEHPMMLEDDFGWGSRKRLSTHKTKIRDVELKEKQEFFYLFDMGDEWWHKIRVEKIEENDTVKGRSKRREVVKIKGESPPQYPEPEEEEGPPEDYELVFEKMGPITVGRYVPKEK